jgi:iron complex transport system substrate-binding protein
MQNRISAITDTVRGLPVPTVVLLEWTDPVFAVGNWAPELVEAAGGRPLLSDGGQLSSTILWERVLDANPDYLIVAPCGFDLDRTVREVSVLEALPGWSNLTAVKRRRVVFADGNKYFNRSGTTIVETVEILAEILCGVQTTRPWHGQAWLNYRDIPVSHP